MALITGGSRGIGLATARLLAGRGYRLVITARGEQGLAEAADQLRPIAPDLCHCAADVGDPAAVARLMGLIDAQCGRLDVLINNAGGSHHGRHLDAMGPEDWDLTLRQNLTAASLVCRAALPFLKARGGGRSSTSPRWRAVSALWSPPAITRRPRQD